ncbi:unnamed protein product [Paramecium primaurelia]|uniref:Uncharacterized protein n=2 Tax=Paramecium TaxID=5884 RepID=A0A8S1SCS6_9CILI|nr:unnamed protein product [Paramecium primaurelia]CAD8137430.1 unnamed protein product [Paramecium pentaurelia]
MYRTKQSYSEYDSSNINNSKMITQKYQNQQYYNDNSGRLGIALPELQKYQKQCLQQTNPTQRSDLDREMTWTKKQIIKEQKIQHNRRIRQKLDSDNSFSQNYSVDDQIRIRRKANLSSYMFGGFVLQDYNEQVNKLHKLLLKKVILNR